MQINPYWRLQVHCLLLACAGLVVYVVGLTDGLRTVGALVCAAAVLLFAFNLIMEAIRTLRRSR